MPLISNLTTIVLLLIAHCGSWTWANRLGPFKICPSCRDPLGAGRPPRDHNAAGSTLVLALGPHPSHSGDIEKAPCRKLLNSVLRGLELTIFQSDRDIYIPNCDTRGFYRKKQVEYTNPPMLAAETADHAQQ
ncbi:hypothetical protein CRUP_038766 [Coryphaenoides rupestris]|nr:hypothetical protein CRUP_038766 [Coryphaenoides rupestris]